MKIIAVVLLMSTPLLASAADVGGAVDGGAYDAARAQAQTGVAALHDVKQISYTVTITEKGKVLYDFAGVLNADGREHLSSSTSEHPYLTGDNVTRKVDTGLFMSVRPAIRSDGTIVLGLKLNDSVLVGMDAIEWQGTSGQSPWVAEEALERSVCLVSGKRISMPFGKSGRSVTVQAKVI